MGWGRGVVGAQRHEIPASTTTPSVPTPSGLSRPPDEPRPAGGETRVSVLDDRTCPLLEKRKGGLRLSSLSHIFFSVALGVLCVLCVRLVLGGCVRLFPCPPPPPSFLGFTVAVMPIFSYIGSLIV
jgi:hypothetical protein